MRNRGREREREDEWRPKEERLSATPSSCFSALFATILEKYFLSILLSAIFSLQTKGKYFIQTQRLDVLRVLNVQPQHIIRNVVFVETTVDRAHIAVVLVIPAALSYEKRERKRSKANVKGANSD